jgi:hypothetical protein
MSLIGSLTLMRTVSVRPLAGELRNDYQLDFVTPGSLPSEASSRKQIRQTPNFRMYARLRPQSLHRFTWRTSNFAGRDAFTIHDFFAIDGSPTLPS